MVAFRLDLKVGDVIDEKYQIVKSIGSGSYGDVFLVKDSHGQYAMKILRLFDESSELHEELVKRFTQEYETAKMPGDYFVHSLDYSEMKGNPYFTMEYCPKGDLAKYVGKNTSLLPRMAHDILFGLHDLHSSGKIHRDLKPENVLVRENDRAALTDFGVVGNKNASKRISTRSIFGRPKQKFGSPLYMAPEMNDLKGGGVTYLQTIDIWSFGVMFYELLTGGIFPFGNPQDLIELPKYQENAKKGRWSRQSLRDVPHGREWLPIIERCLMPDYQDRYQNVLELLKDIEPLSGDFRPTPIPNGEPRSASIRRLMITQGESTGQTFSLDAILSGKGRMIRVGRSRENNIVLREKENEDTFVSRHHFTIERSIDGRYWTIKDGQWLKEERGWKLSTNGTYLNASRVTSEGQRLFTGDIITAGEFKLKVE